MANREARRRKRRALIETLEQRQLLARDVSGVINADETWNGTIQVTGDVTIPEGVKLTIESGTVVKFQTGRWLNGIGVVDAIGTAAAPIVFTSVQDDSVGEDLTPSGDGMPRRGDWETLILDSNTITLSHVEVRYGGSTSGPNNGDSVGAVEIDTDASPLLDDVLITESDFIGLDIRSGMPTLRNVRVTESDSVAIRQAFAADATYDNVTAINNAGGDHVQLAGGTLTTDRTWDFDGLPVHLTSDVTISQLDGVPATLAVAPGSVVKVGSGRFISASPGILKAEGTVDAPIVFTSQQDDTAGGDSNADGDASSPQRGNWESIYLRSDDSVLSNVEVRYAGSTSGPNNGDSLGAVEIQNSPQLSNVRITENDFIGMDIESGNPTLQNVLITNSDAYAIRQAFAADPIYDGVVARDNDGGDHVQLAGGTLMTDRTWDFSGLPIHLAGNLTISQQDSIPATLTVVPGSVVKVTTGALISANPGILKAEGTVDAPIVFTSWHDDTVGGDSNADGEATLPRRGDWESIYLWSDDSVLSNVEVRYAGSTSGPNNGDSLGAIEINASPTLTNVRVTENDFIGIDIESGNSTLQNIVITDSDGYAIRQAFVADPIYDGVTARNNEGGDHVRLAGGTLRTDRTWDFDGLPIHLAGNLTISQLDNVPATLTVVPGSVVKVASGALISANPGILNATGTVDAPIVFTSLQDDTVGGDSNADGDTTSPQRGNWESIYLWSDESVLANVEVRYAGSTSGPNNGDSLGAIEINASPSLTNVRITENDFIGIDIESGTSLLQNIVVTNSDSYAIRQAFAADPVYDGVTARSNEGGDHVQLAGGTLRTDRTWDFDGLPIHLAGNLTISQQDNVPSTLTVVPGSVVKVASGALISANPGILKAEGTVDAPIVFTSQQDDTVGGDSNADGETSAPLPGNWESIYLWSDESVLSHAEVRYAGSTSGPNNGNSVAAIDIREDASVFDTTIASSNNRGVRVHGGANVDLTRLRVIDVDAQGVHVDDGSVTLTDVDFLGGVEGVLIDNGSNATATGSSFVGQTSFAVRHLGSDRSAAVFTENYWGHPGGPHDPSGSDGFVNNNPLGTPVSDFVDYGAFLSLPPRPLGPRALSVERLTPIPAPQHHRYEAENTALDQSGTRNGMLVGDATFAAGRVAGSAFSLDGDGDYVALGNWAPQSEWTLAAWVNPNSVPATGRLTIVGGDAANRDWSIGIRDGNYVANYRDNQFIDSGVAASANVWTHIAATLRGSDLTLFLDGIGRGSVDIGTPYVPTDSSIRIGSSSFNNAGFFAGRIDEVSIVERGVSDVEIESLRDSGTIDFVPEKERLLVTFDSSIQASSVGVDDFSLTGPSPVDVESAVVTSDRTAEVILDGEFTNAGDHTLSVGPQILGSAGIEMDQDLDGIGGEPVEDVFQGTITVDKSGPRIVSQLPDGTTSSVLSSITVTFNEPITPTSLTTSDVRLISPATRAAEAAFAPLSLNGLFNVRAARAIDSFSNLDGALAVLDDESLRSELVTETQPVINYGPSGQHFGGNKVNPLDTPVDDNYLVLEATATLVVPAPGPYTFAIGSDDGFRLEIGDEFSAEFTTGRGFTTDLATFDFPAAGEYALKFIGFELTGSSGFELSSAQGVKSEFDDDFVLVGEEAFFDGHLSTLGVEPVDDTNATFRLSFPPQPIDGEYELTIQPAARDTSGNLHDQDINGVGGENTDVYTSTITVDRQPLRIVSQSPSGTKVGALESLDVTFNVPITEGSFSTSDVRITGPAGVVPPTSIQRINETTYRIHLTRSTADGVYDIVVGPGIADVGGTLMDSDGDAIPGEVADRYVSTLNLTGAGPFVTNFDPRGTLPAPQGSVDVTFSEEVDLSSFTAADVVITGPDGVVPVTGITFDGQQTYRLSFAPQSTSGVYTVAIGPDLTDSAGTLMDQDQDGAGGELVEDVYTDSFAIDSGGPAVLSYTPDFVSRPYTFVDIVFNEDIDVTTFTPQDVAMTGPNGVVPVSQVVAQDMDKVRVMFPTQSTLGTYSLIIGPDIFDPTGNAMNQDGDNVFGEADEDTFTATITFEAPDILIESLDGPSSAKNGDALTISYTVRNAGDTAAAEPWTDRLVLSEDNVYGNAGDIELGTLTRTNDLAQGESYTGMIDVSIPFEIDGDYFLLIRTDSSNQVFESNDVNNTSSVPIEIAVADPPADLIVDAITVPSTGFIGDSIDVTWRVRNDGTATTIADRWVDRLYLSSDNAVGGDVLIGSVTHDGSLGSNASYTMTQSVVVPASVTPGDYFVVVQTDATNQVQEPTAEGNNLTVLKLGREHPNRSASGSGRQRRGPVGRAKPD